jgi:uncharacterized protein YbcI
MKMISSYMTEKFAYRTEDINKESPAKNVLISLQNFLTEGEQAPT